MQSNDLNIAVIGSSGGLGFEFVNQLSQENNVKSIFAFSRSEVDFNNKKVKSFFINIEDEESVKLAASQASKDADIDIVIVATGMLHSENINPEKSLKDLSREKFNKLFSINTIAPAIIAKHFLPKLNKNSRSIFAALSACFFLSKIS